jgi:hypothetical protein
MNTWKLAILTAVLTGSAQAAEQAPAPAPAAEGSAPPAAAPAKAATTGSVGRAQFTSAIADREPTDSLRTLANDKNRILFYSELKGLAGQTVTHRWEYNGKVMAEVPFQIGAERWRVFSSKTLDPLWLGEWKVSVVDAGGATLSVNTFSYTPVPKQEAAPAAAAPAAPAAPAGEATTKP